ncbi:MAG: mammalian cell entry protein [Solirubrobacterales bacterium]|nr:mammalian cell entry protein [Solirubrobacterales bacterium]
MPAHGPFASRVRALCAALLLTAAIVVVIVLANGGDERHEIVVTVASATNVVPGQDIREAGVKVGSVASLTPVRKGRATRIKLTIDERAWPLPRASKMTLRWGGTVSYGNRYIALIPSKARGAMLADHGTLPAGNFTIPVEFDQLLGTFTTPVRRDLRNLVDRAGGALLAARPGLERTLERAPAALNEASFVLRDLTADDAALHTLAQAGDDVLSAVAGAQPDLRSLLTDASTTFTAVGDRAGELRDVLQQAPGTLRVARDTLARADTTLDRADDVVGRLKPGVTQLRRIATPLDHVLGTVVEVAPDARGTLASLRAAAPSLNPLLAKVTTLSPQLERIGSQAVDNLNCIRPYTPDIVSFFTNWGDALSYDDKKDKIFRAQVQNFLPAPVNASPLNSGQLKKIFPGLEYGFPRPPGTNAGQPWFLPECGAGPDALDPDKDPEARPFSQVMHMPPLSPISGRP